MASSGTAAWVDLGFFVRVERHGVVVGACERERHYSDGADLVYVLRERECCVLAWPSLLDYQRDTRGVAEEQRRSDRRLVGVTVALPLKDFLRHVAHGGVVGALRVVALTAKTSTSCC
jgi:hypothetical protein